MYNEASRLPVFFMENQYFSLRICRVAIPRNKCPYLGAKYLDSMSQRSLGLQKRAADTGLTEAVRKLLRRRGMASVI